MQRQVILIANSRWMNDAFEKETGAVPKGCSRSKTKTQTKIENCHYMVAMHAVFASSAWLARIHAMTAIFSMSESSELSV